jgi:hypothetical protein
MTRALALSTDADHYATLAREVELAHEQTRRLMDLREEVRRLGRAGELALRCADRDSRCRRCRFDRNSAAYRKPPGTHSLIKQLLGDHTGVGCVEAMARRVHPNGTVSVPATALRPAVSKPLRLRPWESLAASAIVQPQVRYGARSIASMRRLGIDPEGYFQRSAPPDADKDEPPRSRWPEEPGKMPYDEWATIPSRRVTVDLYGDREEVYRRLRAAGFADGAGS